MKMFISLALLLGLLIGTGYAMTPTSGDKVIHPEEQPGSLLTRDGVRPMSPIPGAGQALPGKPVRVAQTCRQRCRLLRSSCSSAPKVCSAHYQMCISRCP